MKILDHKWGLSPAQDRVWGLVSAYAPSSSWKRLLMVLEAYMDESIGVDDGTLTLAGHVASVEQWAKFSGVWESYLQRITPNENGKRVFKMAEMNHPDKMWLVRAFWLAIENNVMMSLSYRVNIHEIEKAKDRIYVEGLQINWGYLSNPYLVAYQGLMDCFHAWRSKVDSFIPPSEPVNFIFDDRSEEKQIREAWESYVKSVDPEIQRLYGAKPRFENDEDILPLQAADLWAWWVRKWHSEGTPEKMAEPELGLDKNRKSGKRLMKMAMSIDEDGLVKVLKKIIRERIEPGRPIWDVKYKIEI